MRAWLARPALLVLLLALPPGLATYHAAPPTVAITEPGDAEVVSGVVTVRGTASASGGSPDRVQVRLDDGRGWNEAVLEDGGAWHWSWNTKLGADGRYRIDARAHAGGATSDLATRFVDVNNSAPNVPPTVTVLEPAEGASLSGVVELEGTARDEDGLIAQVRLALDDDGVWMAADGREAWRFELDTRLLEDGEHVFHVVATDDENAPSPIAERAFVVANGRDGTNRPPSVVVTDPTDGARVRGLVLVHGTSSDADGPVVQVEARVDRGVWHDVRGARSWQYGWESTAVPDGEHVLEFRAYDGDLHSSIAQLRLVVDNVRTAEENALPEVEIVLPAEGERVSGRTVVQGTAGDPDDDNEVRFVEVQVPGVFGWQRAEGTTSWRLVWDTLLLPPGPYTIEARADDGFHYSEITRRTVLVQHEETSEPPPPPSGPNRPPELILSAPRQEARAAGVLHVAGLARDPDGDPLALQVSFDGAPYRTHTLSGGAQFAVDVPLAGLVPGPHSVAIRLFDGELVSPGVTVVVHVEEVRAGEGGNETGILPTPGAGLVLVVVGWVVAVGLRCRYDR